MFIHYTFVLLFSINVKVFVNTIYAYVNSPIDISVIFICFKTIDYKSVFSGNTQFSNVRISTENHL